MRIIIAIILVLFSLTSSATNKYVDSTGGNDSWSGNSPDSAYKSITKVNSIYSTLTTGDSILFKRGEVWHNRLNISKSGMHLAAYGTGNKPLISGFTTVTGWTNVSGNIWQSGIITGTNTYMSMVTVNDVAIAMGRWPNAGTANGGYAVYDSMNSLTQIRSITAMPFDFTGMQLCWRKIADILARETVTSISGTTINHENLTGSNYKGFDGYGYFVQGGLATLDVQNEWYFNTSTRRLSMYSTSSPTGVKISTIDTLIWVGAFDNTTFDDIALEGGNVVGLTLGGPTVGNSTNITINRCDFVNMGRDGIFATNDNNLVIDSCYFNHINSNGVYMGNQGGNSINATLKYNVLRNIGMRGMGFLDYSNGFKLTYEGITNGSSAVVGQLGMTVKFNFIDTVGHIGIRFFQNDTFVDSNYVNYHNYITDDAGAINTFDNTFGAIVETNRTIIGNICNNGIGAGLGGRGTPNVNGIYVDDKADGIIIRRNFVGTILSTAGSFDGSCIYIHNGTNIDILNNVNYNGEYSQITLSHDNHAIGMPIRNLNVQNNLSFAKRNNSLFLVTRTYRNDVDSIYNPINNNRYWRPTLITGATFQTVTHYQNSPQVVSNYTLPTWQAAFAGDNYDAASTQGASNTGATDMVWNFSNTDSTINFSGLSYVVPQYNSPYQMVYNNSMVLAPYTGYIRIANGSAPPVNVFPTANVTNTPISITLPTATANIIATGTDSDGFIVLYSWSQISGPNTATITPSSSLSTGNTTVSGLIQGIYQFMITVTDNNGATGTALANVTVNAAIPNTPPTVNAGVDKAITLPVTTSSATATFTNGSGSSGTFSWTQIGVTPSVATVNSPSSATTTFSNLNTVGTYKFKIVYTNNLLDSATDEMQVVVSPAVAPPNLPPVANIAVTPGINITLPTNSVVLNGTGSTDPEGGGLTYVWSQTSGPTTATNSTPTGSTTTMGSLSVGQYIFTLVVKDVGDSTGTQSVTITVNPAPVLNPPIANAGADKNLTLPVNFTTLTGSGTNGSGTITSQAWTLFSTTAIAPGVIVTPSAYQTDITNLSEGTYLFKLTVTDSNSLTATDLVQIIVRSQTIQQRVLLRGYRFP